MSGLGGPSAMGGLGLPDLVAATAAPGSAGSSRRGFLAGIDMALEFGVARAFLPQHAFLGKMAAIEWRHGLNGGAPTQGRCDQERYEKGIGFD